MLKFVKKKRKKPNVATYPLKMPNLRMDTPGDSSRSSERQKLIEAQERNKMEHRVLDTEQNQLLDGEETEGGDQEPFYGGFSSSRLLSDFGVKKKKNIFELQKPWNQLDPHPRKGSVQLTKFRNLVNKIMNKINTQKNLDNIRGVIDDEKVTGVDNVESASKNEDEVWLAISGSNYFWYFWDFLVLIAYMWNIVIYALM